MQIDQVLHYPTSLPNVWDMFADEQFHRTRLTSAPVTVEDVEVHRTPHELEVAVQLTGDPEASPLPSSFLRFLPRGPVELTVREVWDLKTARGKTTIDTILPVRAQVESALAAVRADGAREEVERKLTGTLTIAVPLMGKSLESKAGQYLPRMMRAEEQAAQQYLQQN
ncbi:DUF2505 family protein [Gleimia hominis]|uniref:DUF2505 family protein n=1 Tax=Gleimia hominis TaxID=595468 RepID=UPI000C801A38|nr:DUF2505 family protein [Gleimia hominis]WIK63672.1 DUF2505 family protein [Gleimia hominis]